MCDLKDSASSNGFTILDKRPADRFNGLKSPAECARMAEGAASIGSVHHPGSTILNRTSSTWV